MRSVKKKGLLGDLRESLIHRLFQVSGMLAILILAGILALLLYTSIPAFKEIGFKEFLTSTRWDPTSPEKPEYGFLSMLASTFMITIGAMLIAFPLGVAVASYLSDVASPRVREIVKPIVELLAAIPSVVVGFIGLNLVGPFLARIFNQSNGLNALNGSLLLAIMALPTIITIAEDAIRSTPVSLKEASLALGATHWQSIRLVILPYARSGIMAAFILGIGRAIGETMAVLMVTGNAAVMPSTFLEPVRTIPATIAAELGEAPFGGTHFKALFTLGIILFVITFLINTAVELIKPKKP